MATELAFLSLLDATALVQAREISAVELVQDQLDRTSRLDPILGSYAHLCAPQAIEAARLADEEIARGAIRGPLHGAPIAIKDLIWTRGVRTAAGTRIHDRFIPPVDALCWSALKAAGAILLGKLTTTEAAYSTHHPDVPPPVNPWDRHRWSGASSSGSGVAVAAGLCYGSLGTDTSGSIRLPAAMNGVVGFKPTPKRTSQAGVFAFAPSFDVVGPIARTVGDAAALFTAIDLQPLRPAPRGDLAGRVVGFDEQHMANADPVTRQAVLDAVATLVALGAAAEPVRMPSAAALPAAMILLAGREVVHEHRATYPTRKADYGGLADYLAFAQTIEDAAHARAGQQRSAFSAALTALFERIDLLVLPTIGRSDMPVDMIDHVETPEQAIEIFTGGTLPFNMAGCPAISLPGGVDAHGIPVSFQLVAAPGRDEHLIAAALRFEEATRWHGLHPDLG